MSRRDLGGMGEAYFEHLCNEVGLVPTRIKQDKTGWDYFVEFPSLENPLHRPAAACRVQVKATDRADDFVNGITLHNWHRLITEPSPAFFCVFRYSGDRTPSAAYLVHVDATTISAVLKRLRELERDGVAKPLARTRRLRWTKDARLTEVTGEALKQALVDEIGDLYEYSRKKMALVQGSQGPPITTEFTVETHAPDGMHPHELLVELALNLRDSIPSKFTRYVENRFGVGLDRMAQLPAVLGKLSISRVPTGEAEVCFRSEKSEARFRCAVYNPLLVFPFIEERFVRFRFESTYVHFVTRNPNQVDFTILETIHAGPVPLVEAVEVAKLITITHSPDPFEFVLGSGESSKTIACTPQAPNSEEPTKLAYIIECAWRVVRAFDLPTDMTITTDQLWREEERLRVLGTLVLKPKTVPNILTCIVDDVEEYRNADAAGIPYVAAAAIGNRFVVGAFGLYGVPNISEQADGAWEVKVEASGTEMVKCEVHLLGDPESIDPRPLLQAAREWLERQAVALLPYVGTGQE